MDLQKSNRQICFVSFAFISGSSSVISYNLDMLDFQHIYLLVCLKLFIGTRCVNLINFIEKSGGDFLAFSGIPINCTDDTEIVFYCYFNGLVSWTLLLSADLPARQEPQFSACVHQPRNPASRVRWQEVTF
jgi:hypothetical protein